MRHQDQPTLGRIPVMGGMRKLHRETDSPKRAFPRYLRSQGALSIVGPEPGGNGGVRVDRDDLTYLYKFPSQPPLPPTPLDFLLFLRA